MAMTMAALKLRIQQWQESLTLSSSGQLHGILHLPFSQLVCSEVNSKHKGHNLKSRKEIKRQVKQFGRRAIRKYVTTKVSLYATASFVTRLTQSPCVQGKISTKPEFLDAAAKAEIAKLNKTLKKAAAKKAKAADMQAKMPKASAKSGQPAAKKQKVAATKAAAAKRRKELEVEEDDEEEEGLDEEESEEEEDPEEPEGSSDDSDDKDDDGDGSD